jgi:hypothetical protein
VGAAQFDYRSRIQGPFEVIQYGGLEGEPIVTIPFAAVDGGQVAISVADNFVQFAIQAIGAARDARYFATVEIGIWGHVQGEEFLILRDNIRAAAGPLVYSFKRWESYDRIVVKARNMSGGVPGGSFSAYPPVAVTEPSQPNGASLQVMVFVQPRAGLGFGIAPGGG